MRGFNFFIESVTLPINLGKVSTFGLNGLTLTALNLTCLELPLYLKIIGYAAVGFSGLYLIILMLFSRGWWYTGMFKPEGFAKQKATIVVAMRNEEQHVQTVLKHLLKQDYPKELTEIILIDDHSDDRTLQLAQKTRDPRLKILGLREGQTGKKAAIEMGVATATGHWILTTDADCLVSPKWLSTTLAYGEALERNMVLGLVAYRNRPGFLNKVQQLELAALMCVTAGSLKLGLPLMANGANFAYHKNLFTQLNGYAGTGKSPSGDDMMLLLKAGKAGLRKPGFLISHASIVFTEAAPNWDSFFSQRMRWAGKSAGMGDWRVSAVMGFNYLVNLALVLLTVAFISQPHLFVFLALAWGLKLLADLAAMAGPLWLMGRLGLLVWLLPAQLFYTFFVAMTGPLSLVLPIRWKGRKY